MALAVYNQAYFGIHLTTYNIFGQQCDYGDMAPNSGPWYLTSGTCADYSGMFTIRAQGTPSDGVPIDVSQNMTGVAGDHSATFQRASNGGWRWEYHY